MANGLIKTSAANVFIQKRISFDRKQYYKIIEQVAPGLFISWNGIFSTQPGAESEISKRLHMEAAQ